MKLHYRLLALVALVMAPVGVWGQQNVYWRDVAANGNWQNGDCSEIGNVDSQWWYEGFGGNSARNRPDCTNGLTTRHNLEIGNNHHTTMTLNETFWGARQLILTSGTTSNRTFNGSVDDASRGLSLTNGLFNNAISGVTHTFNVRIGIDASSVTLRTTTTGAITTYTREIFGNSNTITFDGSGITNVNAVISGSSANLIKSGAGTLKISSTPSYGGTTTLNDGVFELSANLTSSTITANGGTLSITENVTVGSVTINSGATLSVASGKTLTVNGTLTIATGANVSDEVLQRIVISGTGSIVTSNPSGLDAATFSRQITGGAGWRILSVPKSGMTVADLASQTAIQGVAGGAHTDRESNLFTGYTTGTDAWVSAANHSDVLGHGSGFALYFFNNSTAGSSPLPITLTATGSDGSDVSPSLSGDGNGFNMIGNPYGYAIDVRKLIGKGATVPTVLQLWDDSGNATTDANGNVGTWVSTSSTSHKLGVWQGAFIENSNDASHVYLPNLAKLNETGSFYKEIEHDERFMTFRLDGFNEETGIRTLDRAATVYFHATATEGWDQWDASKIRPLVSSTGTIGFIGERNGQPRLQSQYSMPFELNGLREIPLDFQVSNMGGEFTVSAETLTGIPSDWAVGLRDNQTGAVINLRETAYTFGHNVLAKPVARDIDPTPVAMQATSSPRFTLLVGPGTITSVDDPASRQPLAVGLNPAFPNPFNPSTVVGYQLSVFGKTRLAVYDLLGREVAVLVDGVMPAGSHSATFDAAGLSSGVYMVRLESGGRVETQRVTLLK